MDEKVITFEAILVLFTMLLLLRIAELFEIIVDYPESEPAFKDLAVSLKRVEMKSSLISSLDKRFAVYY